MTREELTKIIGDNMDEYGDLAVIQFTDAILSRLSAEQGADKGEQGFREVVISKCEALIKECKDGNSTFDSGATRSAQAVLWEVLNFKTKAKQEALK